MDMGGQNYMAGEAKGANWTVGAGSDLTIAYTTQQGEEKNVTINAVEGDNIEELATYINGQQNDVKASVSEEGKLQVFASTQTIQDGAIELGGSIASELDMGEGQQMTVNDIDVTTVAGSQQAMSIIDGALKSVDSERASLGAFQNRFGHAINNLENINENVNASRSRIKDTDFAKETTQMTKSQILQNASTSVLAQAKQSPTAALSLLG
jgi:flagellin